MYDRYDIFEYLACGSLPWRGSCSSLDEVHRKPSEFSKRFKREQEGAN
jgi:hypothetical protein